MVTTTNIDNNNQDKDKDNNVNDLYRCTHFTLTTRKINDKLTELVCINCDQVVATWEQLTKEEERNYLELQQIKQSKDIANRNMKKYYCYYEELSDDVIKEFI